MQWIDVKTALPDDAQTVLTASRRGANQRGAVWIGYCENGRWFNVDGFSARPEVTHWAPLPEGPR